MEWFTVLFSFGQCSEAQRVFLLWRDWRWTGAQSNCPTQFKQSQVSSPGKSSQFTVNIYSHQELNVTPWPKILLRNTYFVLLFFYVFIELMKIMNGNVKFILFFMCLKNVLLKKNKKEHFENTLNLNWEEYQAGYLYYNGLGNVFRMKGCHIVWWKLKWPTYRGLNSKTPRKSKWKKWCSRLVHFAEISLQQLKMVLFNLYGPPRACMHAWHRGMLLMRWGMASLVGLDQGITELLESLRCNLAAKHNVPEVFCWI